MKTEQPAPAIGLTTISRTVASLAVGVVHTLERAVVGEERMRTARGNAWEAVCADRARADRQAELHRLVEELAAARAARDRATGGGRDRSRTAGGGRTRVGGRQPVS